MTERRLFILPQALLGMLFVLLLVVAGPALARKSETISCKRIPELSSTLPWETRSRSEWTWL